VSNADGTRNDAANYGNYATWIATVSRFLQSSLSSAHDNDDDILRLQRAQRFDAGHQRSMQSLNRSRDSNSNDDVNGVNAECRQRARKLLVACESRRISDQQTAELCSTVLRRVWRKSTTK
jgi:hypothetical protein